MDFAYFGAFGIYNIRDTWPRRAISKKETLSDVLTEIGLHESLQTMESQCPGTGKVGYGRVESGRGLKSEGKQEGRRLKRRI